MLLYNPFENNRDLFSFISTIDKNKKRVRLQEVFISCKYFADAVHLIEGFVF